MRAGDCEAVREWRIKRHNPCRGIVVQRILVVCVCSSATYSTVITDGKQTIYVYLQHKTLPKNMLCPHLSEGKEAFPAVRAAERLLLCVVGELVLTELVRGREALVTLVACEDCVTLQNEKKTTVKYIYYLNSRLYSLKKSEKTSQLKKITLKNLIEAYRYLSGKQRNSIAAVLKFPPLYLSPLKNIFPQIYYTYFTNQMINERIWISRLTHYKNKSQLLHMN